MGLGGAHIGWVGAWWPLATLTAQRNQLVLYALLGGKYTFRPEQVVAIEKCSGWRWDILGVVWGIRIQHNIPTYPRTIIFSCLGSRGSLIKRIKETGFVPSGAPNSALANRGIPVRWQAIVAMVALWNALFLLDRHKAGGTGELGVFALVALLSLFAGSTMIWWSRLLQHAVLKPQRTCTEIKAWLYLLAFLSGLMSLLMIPGQFVGWFR